METPEDVVNDLLTLWTAQREAARLEKLRGGDA